MHQFKKVENKKIIFNNQCEGITLQIENFAFIKSIDDDYSSHRTNKDWGNGRSRIGSMMSRLKFQSYSCGPPLAAYKSSYPMSSSPHQSVSSSSSPSSSSSSSDSSSPSFPMSSSSSSPLMTSCLISSLP